VLTPEAIAALLHPYLATTPSPSTPALPRTSNLEPRTLPTGLYQQLSQYLQLILKWNARTNLTAIRTPEEIVRRHFGESLFAGTHLGPCKTLLDFGSGAGFPGIPIQLLRPEIQITLAESQNKKASFLREVVRTLGLSTEIWPNRVESMPPDRKFETVTLRAVDDMDAAIREATKRATNRVLILTTAQSRTGPQNGTSMPIPIPNSTDRVLQMFHVEHSPKI
jgi:16S rRNA (guanine527-N7)-methyltransferase